METASSAVWSKAFAPLTRDLLSFEGALPSGLPVTPELLAGQVQKLLNSHARLNALVRWTSVLVRLRHSARPFPRPRSGGVPAICANAGS